MNPKSTTTPLRLDGIVRVAKTGDRDTLRSPEQQERDIRRWAKEHGHEIVHVHVAIDQTGRKRTGHPAVESAKARALDGVVDGVVAAYVSRFTRNTLYGLTTVAELLDNGRYFFAPECPFDLRTRIRLTWSGLGWASGGSFPFASGSGSAVGPAAGVSIISSAVVPE